MFGVAVLMILGYSLADAATEMYEVGSYPETAAQDGFLENANNRVEAKTEVYRYGYPP